MKYIRCTNVSKVTPLRMRYECLSHRTITRAMWVSPDESVKSDNPFNHLSKFFPKFSLMSCCNHNKCGTTHEHSAHDEFEDDPCMVKEIAQAEKARIKYDFLKQQSDRMLMNLNIRTNKYRLRSAVAGVDHQSESESCCSSDEDLSGPAWESLVPSRYSEICNTWKDCHVFLYCVPCDSVDDPDSFEKFENALKTLPMAKYSSVKFVRFSKKLCVCGNCPDVETRTTGALRSVAMLLRKFPSVVVTRNGGMTGLWHDRDNSAASVVDFIRKYL